jgi:hypothetical protein
MNAKTPKKFSLTPAPTPLDSALHSERDIAKHRRLYCGHYNDCLSLSVREGWAGFTCLNCPLKDLAVTGLTSEPFAHQRRNLDSA